MSAPNNGGPAFPISLPGWGDNGAHGMTLRDYFAAKALVGLLASPRSPGEEDGDIMATDVARLSYAMADAMLKAREVQP